MTIKIANLYNTILKETKLDVIVEKKDKLYIGKLFFESLGDYEVEEVYEEIELADDSSNIDIANALYPLYEKYNMLAKDGTTFQVTSHWSWVNGLAERLEVA